MRRLIVLSLLAACSNSADPVAPDARTGSGIDAVPTVDAGPPLDILRINEVVATGAPDWVEVVNMSATPVELSEYCYVDVAGDAAKCKAFPAMQLAAGARYAQDIDDTISGFKIGGDEELWIYRIADQRVSDSVDWAEGDAPANESFARLPDITGTFARTNVVTKNAINAADNPNAPLATLIVNEVAAAETPDWIEIVNATGAAINLEEYCYVDSSAAPCKPFPTMALAAGAYFVVEASTDISGFGLGGDDAVIIKRIADLRVSDTADWPADAAGPTGSSYARSPTIIGAFATDATPTRGVANN